MRIGMEVTVVLRRTECSNRLPELLEGRHKIDPTSQNRLCDYREGRRNPIEAAGKKADGCIENFKLEQVSNLVALRIATVPVAIKYSSGVVSTAAQMVADEVFRITGKVPTQLRLHGVTKSGAKYQKWQALFTRESAPWPGFRLFFESGMVSIFRPRRRVEQCKRCLGFHPTRGCSRALACWNCGSNMHSATECQAPTKCRNCGGPHRSESRNCQARPTRTGPVTKEQLPVIRQYRQREFAVVARAKAATVDVLMDEGTSFGVVDSEEQI
ncbi:hypothetical protein K3495_g12005 [Podosphaera aphanis]|nr:hypothetical protein K3495_g12005 [Podosphaera aphanis]